MSKMIDKLIDKIIEDDLSSVSSRAKKLQKIAARFKKQDPDYGSLFWSPREGLAWSMGDAANYTSGDLKSAFWNEAGVVVDVRDEWMPKRGSGWVMIFPELKRW